MLDPEVITTVPDTPIFSPSLFFAFWFVVLVTCLACKIGGHWSVAGSGELVEGFFSFLFLSGAKD